MVRGHTSAAKKDISEEETSRQDVSAGGDAQFVVTGVSDPFDKNGTVLEVSVLKIVVFSSISLRLGVARRVKVVWRCSSCTVMLVHRFVRDLDWGAEYGFDFRMKASC